LQFDALLRPKRKADGTYTFTLFQGGAALEAERIGAPAPVASKWVPTEAELREYDGNYPLWPTIALRVFSAGAKLFVQGFNQGPLEVSSVDKDTFVAERVGAEPICARGVLVRRYFNSMVCRQVENLPPQRLAPTVAELKRRGVVLTPAASDREDGRPRSVDGVLRRS
jgi:hypothetical protein